MTQHSSTPNPSPRPGVPGAGEDAARLLDPFEAFVAAQSHGIQILQRIWERRLTKEQLFTSGFDKARAGQVISAAATFFKPLRHRRVQADLQHRAAEKQLCLDALIGIASQHRQLIEHPRLIPAKVLTQLIDNADGPVPHIIDTARETIKNINKRTQDILDREAKEEGKDPVEPLPTLSSGTTSDARGRSSTRFTGTDRHNAAIEAAVHPFARKLMRKDPKLSLEEAKGLATLKAFSMLSGGATNLDTTQPIQASAVMVIDDYVSITYNEAGEAIFGMDDGTTITGTELIKHHLADLRRFHIMNKQGQTLALYTTQPDKIDQTLTGIDRDLALENSIRPVPGHLNYGSTRRTISTKQRLATSTATLVCAWPGCTKGAVYSDGHHLVAWKNNGPTDLDNITLLCKYHNGLNDDDRDRPRNGHVFMKDWEIHFQPPDPGSPPTPPIGPLNSLTSVAIAKRTPPVDPQKFTGPRDRHPPDTSTGDPPASQGPPRTTP